MKKIMFHIYSKDKSKGNPSGLPLSFVWSGMFIS